MNRARFVLSTVILAVLSSIGASCSGGYSGKAETLTLAAVPAELNALVYVAEDQEFFARNGLQVILKDYDSGASAAAGMLNGEAEVALAAEFPIVRQVFNEKDIVSLGTVAKYENTYILWRSDSDIKTFRDLKGKKIGVTLQTISEFYLGRTLDLNGMKIQQVTLVDIKAADLEKAIVDGEVDAVATWEPWASRIDQRLGKDAVTMPLQSGQYAYWNLVGTSGWVKSHPRTIERLMKSLMQAEDYLAGHQNEAKAIIRKRIDFDEAYMDIIWPRYQFALSLDQAMIVAMEDEARWMIKNGLTSGNTVPDFKDYIHVESLDAVKPGAASIIR